MVSPRWLKVMPSSHQHPSIWFTIKVVVSIIFNLILCHWASFELLYCIVSCTFVFAFWLFASFVQALPQTVHHLEPLQKK
jgi:hypothetical protein